MRYYGVWDLVFFGRAEGLAWVLLVLLFEIPEGDVDGVGVGGGEGSSRVCLIEGTYIVRPGGRGQEESAKTEQRKDKTYNRRIVIHLPHELPQRRVLLLRYACLHLHLHSPVSFSPCFGSAVNLLRRVGVCIC